MDGHLLISALGLLAASVAAWLTYVHMRNGVQRDFLALQPDVNAVGASHSESDKIYIFTLRIHNLRNSPAYDATISIDGCRGRAEISEIHPFTHPVYGGRRHNEAAIEVGPDDPIRTTRMEAPRLFIRFRDQWNLWYEVSFPVVQEPQADGLFRIDIRYHEPRLIRPKVSFWKMRRFIREIPSS